MIPLNSAWLPAACFLISLLITLAIMNPLIRKLKKNGIVGKDKNKKPETTVAQMGGLGIVVGFGVAMVFAVSALTSMNQEISETHFLLAALATVLTITVIGIIDDLLDIRQSIKAATPALAGLCLLAVKAGTTVMTIPFFGPTDFGFFYYFLVVLGVTGAANGFNMLAGFNGQEAGVGSIAFFFMLLASFYTGALNAAVIAASMLGASLAFLFFNKYPARVFPGDVGTLSMGAALACCAILGNLERVGVILVLPHVVEFFMKARGGFRILPWATPGKNGALRKKSKKSISIMHLILRVSPSNEKTLVLKVWILEALCGIIALLSVVRW